MIDDTLLDAEERMDKALSVAREDLGSVRTGRAAPSIRTVREFVHVRSRVAARCGRFYTGG